MPLALVFEHTYATTPYNSMFGRSQSRVGGRQVRKYPTLLRRQRERER
jgi:hypothetical protein